MRFCKLTIVNWGTIRSFKCNNNPEGILTRFTRHSGTGSCEIVNKKQSEQHECAEKYVVYLGLSKDKCLERLLKTRKHIFPFDVLDLYTQQPDIAKNIFLEISCRICDYTMAGEQKKWEKKQMFSSSFDD